MRQAINLKYFSWFLSASVFGLIFMGALVTSHQAGLAVPDWPTSFGENMFLFPPSKWIGNIFYEHVHRLVASGIGCLTVILCIWVYLKESRNSIRNLCSIALALVIMQGLLGGLTVRLLLPAWVSTLHALFAQTFFLVTLLIALLINEKPFDKTFPQSAHIYKGFFRLGCTGIFLLYIQLFLGAYMRHTEAGLALVDFPSMAGAWWPSLSEDFIARANAMRTALHLVEVSRQQILIHLLHRMFAIVLFAYFCLLTWRSTKLPSNDLTLRRLVLTILLSACVQVGLGIVTVLSGKLPYLTSSHVVFGAFLLGLTLIFTYKAYLAWAGAKQCNTARLPNHQYQP